MSNNIVPTLIIAQALYHRYNEQQREQQREQEEIRARIREEKAAEEKRHKERAAEEKRREERAKYEAQKRETDAQRLDDLRATKGEQWTADDLFWVVEKGEYYVMNTRPDMDRSGILTLGTSKDIIKALDEGADPNAVSKSGEIFSFKLMEFEDEKLIDKVIEKCPDLGVVDKEGETLLMKAVYAGNMVALKKLIEKDPDNINAVTKTGKSALDKAVFLGWYEAANLLIEHGAKVNNEGRATFELVMMPISRFSFYQRGYKKDSLDDKMYKIPELLLKNGAEISKEAVINTFDSCLYEEYHNVEALFLYSFMEKHGIIYSNGDKLLKNAKRLGLSDEKIKEMINSDDYKFTNGDELLKNAKRLGLSDKKIKEMINSDDYKFTSEAYSCCGNLENICALLEKGVKPDYYAILRDTKVLSGGISPLGSSPEELSKMSKEDRVDLFEKSKEFMFKHPRLREAALKNMIDVYYFSSEPEVRDSFKKTLIDLKRGKNYILEVNELKDVIKTSEGKDDKEIKSVGSVGLRTMYGRFVNKTR